MDDDDGKNKPPFCSPGLFVLETRLLNLMRNSLWSLCSASTSSCVILADLGHAISLRARYGRGDDDDDKLSGMHASVPARTREDALGGGVPFRVFQSLIAPQPEKVYNEMEKS